MGGTREKARGVASTLGAARRTVDIKLHTYCLSEVLLVLNAFHDYPDPLQYRELYHQPGASILRVPLVQQGYVRLHHTTSIQYDHPNTER